MSAFECVRRSRYEEHNLHPTQRAQQQRVLANRQRQLHRHGVRAPTGFVQEREAATKQFNAGARDGKEPPPQSEKLVQMIAARSKRAKDLTPRYKWQK